MVLLVVRSNSRGAHHLFDYEEAEMNIPIIASTISGIAEALTAMGYDLMGEISWNRPPMRINGVWRAEIHHG